MTWIWFFKFVFWMFFAMAQVSGLVVCEATRQLVMTQGITFPIDLGMLSIIFVAGIFVGAIKAIQELSK